MSVSRAPGILKLGTQKVQPHFVTVKGVTYKYSLFRKNAGGEVDITDDYDWEEVAQKAIEIVNRLTRTDRFEKGDVYFSGIPEDLSALSAQDRPQVSFVKAKVNILKDSGRQVTREFDGNTLDGDTQQVIQSKLLKISSSLYNLRPSSSRSNAVQLIPHFAVDADGNCLAMSIAHQIIRKQQPEVTVGDQEVKNTAQYLRNEVAKILIGRQDLDRDPAFFEDLSGSIRAIPNAYASTHLAKLKNLARGDFNQKSAEEKQCLRDFYSYYTPDPQAPQNWENDDFVRNAYQFIQGIQEGDAVNHLASLKNLTGKSFNEKTADEKKRLREFYAYYIKNSANLLDSAFLYLVCKIAVRLHDETIFPNGYRIAVIQNNKFVAHFPKNDWGLTKEDTCFVVYDSNSRHYNSVNTDEPEAIRILDTIALEHFFAIAEDPNVRKQDARKYLSEVIRKQFPNVFHALAGSIYDVDYEKWDENKMGTAPGTESKVITYDNGRMEEFGQDRYGEGRLLSLTDDTFDEYFGSNQILSIARAREALLRI